MPFRPAPMSAERQHAPPHSHSVSRRDVLAAAGAVALAGVRWPNRLPGRTARPVPSPSQLAWQRDELALFLHFGVNFFEDERHLSKEQATLSLASIALVAGALGNATSGFLGDRIARRTRGAYALLAGLAFVIGFPFMLVGFSVRDMHLALPALGIGAFCYFLCMPAVNTQIANSVAPEKRAMAYALAVFILHCLGDTAALPAFGRVSEAVGSKQTAYTIFSCSLLLASLSCILAYRFAARENPARPEQT